MRTPDELIQEGECDEMALGCLSVLAELRSRLAAQPFPDDIYEEIRDIIDRYAGEIYEADG